VLDRVDAPVMGVLNVTPDSFSDGGRFAAPDAAAMRAREMAAEGAALLDIGGESTRPGAPPVSTTEELARVLPVVERWPLSAWRLCRWTPPSPR
jgi:dihydropteroate synthase